MPSNAFQLGKLLISSGEVKISPDAVSDEFSTIEQAASTDALTATGNSVGDQRVVGSNLYIWNGSGWYRIALINASPTWDSGGQPSASYTLDADSPQDATVITLAASDPDGLPIQYSHVTSGSMDSMATISQDSSVFTITPKTVTEVGEGVELTGSITFRASDGVNILPYVSSFTLSFVTNIENSRYTILLATATGTSDNSSITDASTSNHTITGASNDDIYSGTFSPYRHGGYSTYFDGNGDYLTASHVSDFNFGSSDFTAETWFNVSDASGTDPFITTSAGQGINGVDYQGIWLGLYQGSYYFIASTNGTSWDISIQAGTPPTNTWTHLCVVRSGNTFTLYVNGVSIGTTTNSGTLTNSNNLIAVGGRMAGSQYSIGYLRDVRVIKGSAVTPDVGGRSGPLTAVPNTTLLTCHLPYIADGSSNNHSITVNGNTSTKPFSPFDHSEYLTTDHGGSLYFDATRLAGNGNSCNIADHDDFNLTSDFTIKFWAYHSYIAATNTNYTYTYFSNYTYNTGGISLRAMGQYSGKLNLYWMNGSSGTRNEFNFYPQAGQWYYYELTRSSNTLTVKVNGTSVGTLDVTNIANPTTNLAIGSSFNPSNSFGENYIDGYISDFQYITGGTSEESSVPTALMSTDTNSKLHIKGTDASVIDKAQTGNIKVRGTATGSSAEVKFANTNSMYLPGSNPNHIRHYGQIYLPSELTIECWVNTSTFNAGYVWCLENYQLEMRINSNGTGVDVYDSGYINFTRAAGAMSTGTWYHIAVCRDSSNVFRAWIDGVRSSQSGTKTTTYNKDHIIIGGEYASATGISWPYHGYVQDLRISNYARYSAADETANIPTEPLKG